MIEFIRRECALDRVHDDVTTRLLGDRVNEIAEGVIRTRQEGVFSGATVVDSFAQAFPELRLLKTAKEAQALQPDDILISFQAPLGVCLSIERVFLNFLTHLCGVATQTRRFVQAVGDRPTRILATRKTLPGLRDLQLRAVESGGGWVHRRSLSDGILLKDNHLAFLSPREALQRARSLRSPLHRVEIEVQDLATLTAVLENPPDVLMLDNLRPAEIAEAMKQIRGKCEVEVSGNVTVEQVKGLADLGVNYISVGRLTHSVPCLDLTMDLLPVKSNP